jgi:hypothetical protein
MSADVAASEAITRARRSARLTGARAARGTRSALRSSASGSRSGTDRRARGHLQKATRPQIRRYVPPLGFGSQPYIRRHPHTSTAPSNYPGQSLAPAAIWHHAPRLDRQFGCLPGRGRHNVGRPRRTRFVRRPKDGRWRDGKRGSGDTGKFEARGPSGA